MDEYDNSLYRNITVERNERTATVTIDRPEVYNAFNGETLLDLRRVFDKFTTDQALEAVVLTGEGENAFSSGADIDEYRGEGYGMDFQAAREELVFDLTETIRTLHAPVIARINGVCVGGGLILAMNCDLRIAISESKFGVPVTDIGQIPGGGGVYEMLQLTNTPKAKELVLTAKLIGADEAEKIGLVNQVVERESLDEAVNDTVASILSTGTMAVKNSKRAINQIADESDRASAHEIERNIWLEQFDTDERRQLVDKFLDE